MCFALERDKGKTVEVGRAYFETEKKHFTILDAPGMFHECKIEFRRNTVVYIYTVMWIRIRIYLGPLIRIQRYKMKGKLS
mgnify:CR=1 FL=1